MLRSSGLESTPGGQGFGLGQVVKQLVDDFIHVVFDMLAANLVG